MWRGSGFPHRRLDVNHQLLLVTLRDSFPLTHLKVSCPIFLYSLPTSAKDYLEVVLIQVH